MNATVQRSSQGSLLQVGENPGNEVGTYFHLASHAGVFGGACLSSLPTNACSTKNNIPFPSLANLIVLSKFWKVDLDRKVIW